LNRTGRNIEIAIHVLFWLLIFPSINVKWSGDWFDPSIRLRSPAPLSVLIFPIFFYVNAFFLIPRYFNVRRWYKYLLGAMGLFVLPELIRCGVYLYWELQSSFEEALFSRDSFLFGAPSPFFLALNLSFLYRFVRDRFFSIQPASMNVQVEEVPSKPYVDIELLSEEEAQSLQHKLEANLTEQQPFLNPELTLRDLAGAIGTSEKKLSYLLNQKMETSFYEFVNSYRVEEFKRVVSQPENQKLSILGVAQNCGFSSKSSFYRTFKSHVGVSPSQFLKKLQQEKK